MEFSLINKSARSLVVFLLFVNGVGALYGSWSLMTDPTGNNLGLPPEWIARIPFRNYFIPGVILFIVNCLLSISAAVATMSRRRGYEKLVIIQGSVLTGWIFVQVIMLQAMVFLHFAMAGIGITTMGLGAILMINRMRQV